MFPPHPWLSGLWVVVNGANLGCSGWRVSFYRSERYFKNLNLRVGIFLKSEKKDFYFHFKNLM